jgi:hypothetical protein
MTSTATSVTARSRAPASAPSAEAQRERQFFAGLAVVFALTVAILRPTKHRRVVPPEMEPE